ncbi:MAG: ferric reductase-like transmembrane domain-containing protein [Bacteroidetes bacterium]|nr:ferric reductase-like transmembrane domain-containing protein [Bacteroidota bacterium]
MSASYQGVLWNRQKRIYDFVLWSFIAVYIALFAFLNYRFDPRITPETLFIRATGTLALLMLHVILSIGPLARIDKRFLILLYNRRHLGVSMFLVAGTHGVFNLAQFHSMGNVNPFVSLFSSNMHYTSFINFPFQVLGFFALLILFMMAATSHDFWLNTLTPRLWKSLHMLVYVAYALVIMHVVLGVLQLEHEPTLFGVLLFGLTWVSGLHLYAGWLEGKRDREASHTEGWVAVGTSDDIEDSRAKIVFVGGERIAVFRYNGKLSAVSNVCKHQNGPLGEGKIVDGCITCPWHGYQYRPEDGCAPPPFKEKVSTFKLKMVNGIIYVSPKPNAEGQFEEPLVIG